MGILNRIKKDKKDTTPSASKAEEQAAKPAAKKPAAKKAPAKGKKAAPAKKQAVKHGAGPRVIVKPLVTEKSATLASANQYVFVIAKSANRVQVRAEIRAMYGITPTSVNIQNYKGKKVRFGRRRGKRKDWKKAIVTLPAGKTINVYDGV